MHEPVGGRWIALPIPQLALVKTVAENPEAQSLGILDAEVVARQPLAVLLPPFHGDALGSLDPHHRMQRTAPGEMMWRTIGDCGQRHLDRLRPVEQAKRS